MACRLDEIPDAGDYVTYQILGQSMVIVRQADGSCKAYENACPHRGTALAMGRGRFQVEQIVCPYHGWKWGLAGENRFVLDPAPFKAGCLDAQALRLKACRIATFANCVWINLDPDAQSFDDFIAPVRDTFDALLLDQMTCEWHKVVHVDANWKVVQEAFLEGYHAPVTHPQFARRLMKPKPGQDQQAAAAARWLSFKISTFDQGHAFHGSRDGGALGMGRVPEDMASQYSHDEQVAFLVDFHESFFEDMHALVLDDELAVARAMRRRTIPEGSTPDAEFQRAMREHYGNQGRPIPSAEAISRAALGHVFPNYTFIPLYGNLIAYRARPSADNDPDRSIFDIWLCRTRPEGQAPPAPPAQYVTDALDPDQMCNFLRQDFANMPRQQIGLHSRGMTTTRLHPNQEQIIANSHAALERFLEA